MADEEIGIDLLLNSGAAATSVKELKQSIRDLQSEALKAGAAGDDALAAKFTSAAGKARDRMADLNKEINAAQDTGSKLGAITGVARSLAGGFAGAAGAAALFGSAQKDVQEQLLKVQGAVALLAGIQEVADIKKNFNLAKQQILNAAALAQTKLKIAAESESVIVSNLAAAAQWALNAAMSANPIMLVVVGIAALVAALSTFDSAAERSQKAQKKLNDEHKIYEGIIDRQIEKQKEYLAIRVNSVKDQEQEIALLKASGASKKEIYEAESELIRRKISDAEVLQKTGQKQGVAEINAYQDLLTQKKVLDAQYKTDVAAENKKNKEKREADNKEEQKKKEDELKKAAENELKLRGELAQSIVNSIADEREKGIANMQLSFRNKLDAIIGDGETEKALRAQIKEEQRLALFTLDTKFEQEDAAKKLAADEKKKADDIKKAAEDKKSAEDKIKLESSIRDAKFNIAQQTLNGLTSLAKLAGLKGKEAEALQKTLAISQIAIDTAKAISATIAGATQAAAAGGPAAPFLMASYIASGIATVLGAMASAKAALSSAGASAAPDSNINVPAFNSSSSSSSTAPLTPQQQNVGNTSTTLTEQAGQQPVIVKAYVVESEMTGTQQHIKNIEQKATFP